AEDGIRDRNVTGVQTCALPIFGPPPGGMPPGGMPPQPPKKSNTGLWVSLGSVGVLAVVALLITGFVAPGFFLSDDDDGGTSAARSEERRVGKEWRSGSAASG